MAAGLYVNLRSIVDNMQDSYQHSTGVGFELFGMPCVKKADTSPVITKPFDPDEGLTCNNITPTHLIHKAGC
jgi:hypothetical protein